jgi:large subunit ribosomal protein L1
MRYLLEKVAPLGAVDLETAVKTLKHLEDNLPKGVRPCRMDQVVEIAVRLGVDTKQADQVVRGSLVLPHGIGKSQRVVVFAQGENAKAATEAGADRVGGKELAEEVKNGWMEFDVAIATPDMMGVVGPLGRVLGPRGLMPSPRAGTVTTDVANTVREYKAGKVEFRADKGGVVHCVVGRMSFDENKLVENVRALIHHVQGLRPSSAKGIYIRNAALSATQSPGIVVAV